MPASSQNVCDGRKVADLIALLDSPVEAEAASALRAIRMLKTKHGGVPFYELIERPDYKAAAWEKFGNPECLKGQMEAAARVEALREDNAQLERDGAALAHELNRQAEIIGELRRQGTARPVAQDPGPVGVVAGGFIAFLLVMGGAALLFLAVWHVVTWLSRG